MAVIGILPQHEIDGCETVSRSINKLLLYTQKKVPAVWTPPQIMCTACHLSPHSSAAEKSCWDSWSSGKSSSPPLQESCWSRDPCGKSLVRVWTRQTRWSDGGLVRRDRPSWEAAQAGTRRHSCLWQTTSSSFNSNGLTGFSTADSWTSLNLFLPSLLFVPGWWQVLLSASRKGPCPPLAGSLVPDRCYSKVIALSCQFLKVCPAPHGPLSAFIAAGQRGASWICNEDGSASEGRRPISVRFVWILLSYRMRQWMGQVG